MDACPTPLEIGKIKMATYGQALEDWLVRCGEIKAAHGLPELEQATDLHSDRMYELADAIMATPAQSMSGILVKLMVCRDDLPREDVRGLSAKAVLSALTNAERLTGGLQVEPGR